MTANEQPMDPLKLPEDHLNFKFLLECIEPGVSDSKIREKAKNTLLSLIERVAYDTLNKYEGVKPEDIPSKVRGDFMARI